MPRVLHPYPIGTLRRHSSKVGAVCIKVHVRFLAGGSAMVVPTATIAGQIADAFKAGPLVSHIAALHCSAQPES